MFRHNSTIRVREKICVSCGKPCVWFSKKRCQQCAKVEDFHAKEEAEAQSDPDLSDLIRVCDKLTSEYVRRKAMDANGKIKCYTCDKDMDYGESQCGHFISRGNLFLRFDTRNLRPQCPTCNQYYHGRIGRFREKLNLEEPGLADILMEESYLVVRATREEVKGYIHEYKEKLKRLR